MDIKQVAKYYQLKLASESISEWELIIKQAAEKSYQLLVGIENHPGITDSDAEDIVDLAIKLNNDLNNLLRHFRNSSRAEIYNQARLCWNLADTIEQRCSSDLSSSKRLQQLAEEISKLMFQNFKDWQPGLKK